MTNSQGHIGDIYSGRGLNQEAITKSVGNTLSQVLGTHSETLGIQVAHF
jgi:hypothetical protein